MMIDADGTLYYQGSSGADDSEERTYVLHPGDTKLSEIKKNATDFPVENPTAQLGLKIIPIP